MLRRLPRVTALGLPSRMLLRGPTMPCVPPAFRKGPVACCHSGPVGGASGHPAEPWGLEPWVAARPISANIELKSRGTLASEATSETGFASAETTGSSPFSPGGRYH
ncbi:UNVERIFIED_CONTAM: hypothetical protein FKN15_042865 [Acipenser sinensis]